MHENPKERMLVHVVKFSSLSDSSLKDAPPLVECFPALLIIGSCASYLALSSLSNAAFDLRGGSVGCIGLMQALTQYSCGFAGSCNSAFGTLWHKVPSSVIWSVSSTYSSRLLQASNLLRYKSPHGTRIRNTRDRAAPS